MTNDVFVAGVGMVPFVKPGASAPYPVMAEQAAREALAHKLGLGGACVVTWYEAIG